MKSTARNAKLLGLALFAVLLAPFTHAQSAAIAIDRTQYFTQTSNSSPTAELLPFSLNVNVRGGLTDMRMWGPAFYKPGSGGVPQSGINAATNTGTLNFPTAPNNGGDFMFVHDFNSAAELEAFYPNGNYGIVFQGSGAPSPATFTAGLTFGSSTYPSVTPRINSVDNGAVWSGGSLHLASTGVTTLTLNTFPEYNTTTFGSVIGIGIYQTSTGNVVGGASLESYYLPLGDSTATPTPVNQPAITQFSINSSWLIPGMAYTIEIHYTVISGRPEEANLNGIEFQGVASARKIATISVMVPSALGADFNVDGKSDLIWTNSGNGDRYVWLMNGTTMSSSVYVGTIGTAWQISGTGDFNADGKTDLIWTNASTGDRYVWLMNGTTMSSSVYVGTIGTAWEISGTGDFNVDGKTDLIWTNVSTGDRYVWLMNGTTMSSSVYVGTIGTAWQISGTGDFNVDGKTDLIWTNASTGDRYIWLMNGTTMASSVYVGTIGTAWQVNN